MRDCAGRDEPVDCPGGADDVLAPGVENRGGVPSRSTPTVLEEGSRLRSNSALTLVSIVDMEPVGRCICGIHVVPFSTCGDGSDGMGG